MNKIQDLENKLCSLNEHITASILAHGPICVCGHQKEYHFDHPFLGLFLRYRKCCASFCECNKFVYHKEVEVFRCNEQKEASS